MKDRRLLFVRRRIEAVAGILALVFLLLGIRAADLQWLQGDELKVKAEKQRLREFAVVAPRGSIRDAHGRILAKSIEVPSIAAMAELVPQARWPDLAAALDIKAETLAQKLQDRHGFVWLKRQTLPEIAERVQALNIPGIRRISEWRRFHPLGPETGHVLGFVGVDGNGLEGLEHSLNAMLGGAAGRKMVRVDARGDLLPDEVWLQRPRAGEDVHLHLDATVQSMAYAALVDGVQRHQAKAGSVVIMRPEDGAVLAMVNWPGFNPNDFRQFRPRQWRNRAITDVLEPGSVLKPFTVAAALRSGRWQAESRIDCENGHFVVADYAIHDVHPEHVLDLTGLIARSSNIGAAKLALDVGPAELHRLLAEVGFGRRSGIELSGESPGILLPRQRWGPVETATIAFGQGVAVTPLQLATAFCVLANGGMYVSPRLVQGQDEVQPQRVLPRSITVQVMRMLEAATGTGGTGRLAVPYGYRVAGKTGTAQKPDGSGGYSPDRFTAAFVGAVPADRPELVIAVVVDEPQGSIYGGQVAAPIFRSIAATVLPYLGVLPALAKPWQPVPASVSLPLAPSEKGTMPSLMGLSLREVKRFAAAHGYPLHVHGAGWVVRQSPQAFTNLPAGSRVEVWLDD